MLKLHYVFYHLVTRQTKKKLRAAELLGNQFLDTAIPWGKQLLYLLLSRCDKGMFLSCYIILRLNASIVKSFVCFDKNWQYPVLKFWETYIRWWASQRVFTKIQFNQGIHKPKFDW